MKTLTVIQKAVKALSEDWERCDEETGRECKGKKCYLGAHRATAILSEWLNGK